MTTEKITAARVQVGDEVLAYPHQWATGDYDAVVLMAMDKPNPAQRFARVVGIERGAGGRRLALDGLGMAWVTGSSKVTVRRIKCAACRKAGPQSACFNQLDNITNPTPARAADCTAD